MTRKSRPAAPKRKMPKAGESAESSTPTLAGMPERGLKIGEAAEVFGVETYVLRFWETQFAFLKPRHSKTKHRFYHDRDLEVLRLIKRLLHEEGFTIAGANKYIRENGLESLLSGKAPSSAIPEPVVSSGEESAHRPAANGEALRVLSEVRRELQTLHKMLE
jgi:DNA-binding transcriptional MerR regulator